MTDHLYVLDGITALHCPDVLQWAEFMSQEDRRQVAITHLSGATISTVFLGIDYNFTGHGDPLLFETLVFYGSGGLGSMLRYFTWAESVAGHEEVVDAVRIEIERSARMSEDVLSAIRARLLTGKG